MQPIVIRFLHKGRGPARDDIARIARIPDTASIKVTFHDKSGLGKVDTSELRLTESSALEYVDAMVHAVMYDTDPVEALQFIFPGFPMVLYTSARLMNHEVRRAIRDMTRMVMESWFAELPEDEEDEGESDTDSSSESTSTSSESSTDSEMPPLVPQSSLWSNYLQSYRLAAADELLPSESL
jgi:hypothetical protein